MIGTINNVTARANFLTVPGRSIDYTTDANGNVTKEVYKNGVGDSAVVLFAINYVYDANNNIVTAYTTTN